MRRLDSLRLDLILAEPPPAIGLGVAILDRLHKAEGLEPHKPGAKPGAIPEEEEGRSGSWRAGE
jgi:hypothetical protein